MLSAIPVAEMDSKLPICKPGEAEARNSIAADLTEVFSVTLQEELSWVPSRWKAPVQCQHPASITICLSACLHALMHGCETAHEQQGRGTSAHLDAKKHLLQQLLWELSFPLRSQIHKAGNTTVVSAAPIADSKLREGIQRW